MTCASADRGPARVLAFVASLVLAACSGGKTPLVIYSPHGRELLTALEQRFEALHPDVDVRWMDMGSQEVLDRLRSERANPQADLWFGGPSPLFARGERDSLLQPIAPDQPQYVSVYRTPAVIEYSSAALTAAEAPHDWDDVLLPKWRGKLLLRDPLASGTMRAIFEMVMMRSLARTGDTAAGWAWLRRLDAQTALAWGVVNRIAPAGKNVVDDAIEWIAPIANGAPIAQAAALAAIDASFDSPLAEGLVIETHEYGKTLASQDRLEALKAFAEKRKPVFQGK